jgi:hypothetical protein
MEKTDAHKMSCRQANLIAWLDAKYLTIQISLAVCGTRRNGYVATAAIGYRINRIGLKGQKRKQ